MATPSPSPLTPSRRVAAVIVAAGQGLRAGQGVPKQFALWRGKPVVRHSVEAMIALGVAPIIVAIPAGAEAIARDALAGLPAVTLVTGGETRQLSVRAALEALDPAAPDQVLIHDAARPVVLAEVVARLLDALAVHAGAIPVLPVVDSLTASADGLMGAPVKREQLRRVQTPQAFRFAPILAAHRARAGEALAGDDAQVAQAAGLEIALVEGDERLHKLTFATDFAPASAPVRVGTGYDVHRLADGEELWLCGVRIDHPRGLAGHSDADVAIHALVDAILGAIGAGDIGTHFPPSDPQWRAVSSDRFLTHAVSLAAQAGFAIGNVDLTLVCEEPRIGPYRQAMRDRLAQLLATDPGNVSIKATTTERLGFTGRSEGIAAQAVATLIRL